MNKLLLVIALLVLTSFIFNMTDRLRQEDKFLPYCYANNEMVIDALNKTCSMMYGGPVG